LNFSKIRGDIREVMFITGEKLFSGVNDTGEKFISPCHGFSVIAGVVDTGDKFIVDKNKDAMEVGSCQG
jgi:hypothetical protein